MANLTKTITNYIGVAKNLVPDGWDIASWDAGEWDTPTSSTEIEELEKLFQKLSSETIAITSDITGVTFYKTIGNGISLDCLYGRTFLKFISRSSLGLSTAIKVNKLSGIWFEVFSDGTINELDSFIPVFTAQTTVATTWIEVVNSATTWSIH